MSGIVNRYPSSRWILLNNKRGVGEPFFIFGVIQNERLQKSQQNF